MESFLFYAFHPIPCSILLEYSGNDEIFVFFTGIADFGAVIFGNRKIDWCYRICSIPIATVRTSMLGAAIFFGSRSYKNRTVIMTYFGDGFISRVIATRASYVCMPTNFGAGGFLSFVCNLIVPKSRDFFIGGVIATRTSYVYLVSRLGAGGSFAVMHNSCMSCRVDYLLYKYFTASGTLFPLCETVLRASIRYCRKNFYSVLMRWRYITTRCRTTGSSPFRHLGGCFSRCCRNCFFLRQKRYVARCQY